MKNIFEQLVYKIVDRMIDKKLISIEDAEVYQFGIEVTLLKTLHIISYIILAVLVGKVFDFIIIFIVFYVFRRNTGGFHAKTRGGCYVFSCAVIFLSLQATKLNIEWWFMVTITIFNLLILILISPVKNSNRGLEVDETEYFKHRLRNSSIMFVILYVVLMALKGWYYITLLTIGLFSVAFLTILGKIQSIKDEP